MNRPPRFAAFTLIEMITVIAIIVILTGLILSINGLVQRKSASARAAGEIQQLSSACESYRNDNGGYPQDTSPQNVTNTLVPQLSTSPMTGSYAAASLFLYEALTGDVNASGQIDSNETQRNYATDFFKPSRLGTMNGATVGTPGYVTYIQDPFGNSYGYSTAGLANEQQYREALASPATASSAQRQSNVGYNSTFDLWSTGGTTGTSSTSTMNWIKNW